MVTIVSVFFTVLAFTRVADVHFWLFDKVKLRDVGTREDAVADFALGKLHQRLQVLDELLHALLVVVERSSVRLLGDEGLAVLLPVAELLLVLFESPLVSYERL